MRILLVDDDPIILEDIRNSIHWEKLGIHSVFTALDATEARAILLREPMDIIVCDIEMPQESGLELLCWYRQQQWDGQFLLLTSYAKFEYATQALQLRAEAYLTKPFNVETMEMALQKAVQDRRKALAQAQTNALGQWIVGNIRETHLSVWHQLLSGSTTTSYQHLIQRLRKTPLEMDMDASYRLVLSKITNLEEDLETYGNELLTFMLQNIQSETFSGAPENQNVLSYNYPGCYLLVAVCPDGPDGDFRRKCTSLQNHFSKLLTSTVTFCIMNPCKIADFHQVFRQGTRLLSQCVAFYGETFFEYQSEDYLHDRAPILKIPQLAEYLETGNKREFMTYLKKVLDARVQSAVLDASMLKSIHREIQQAMYSHMSKQGIQISLLINDSLSESIAAKADRSALDLLRSTDFFLDKLFAYEKELERSRSLIENINNYIHLHYGENIGRNEIGAAFYLVPEYLSKLYKKSTGINLKDYINDYRMEQAKKLLQASKKNVGEIAADVGFDNLSYFSTLFKKNTGMTPLEYRRRHGR